MLSFGIQTVAEGTRNGVYILRSHEQYKLKHREQMNYGCSIFIEDSCISHKFWMNVGKFFQRFYMVLVSFPVFYYNSYKS